jgi:hypothetical protein
VSHQARPAARRPKRALVAIVALATAVLVGCSSSSSAAVADPPAVSAAASAPASAPAASPGATGQPQPRLFAATSLWNTVKTNVTFAPGADHVLSTVTYILNNGAFDHPLYYAKASDPLTTFTLGAGWDNPATTMVLPAPAGMTPAAGSDGALDVRLSDGRLLDLYSATVSGSNVSAVEYALSDAVGGPGFGDATCSCKAAGTTAIGSPQAGGTILATDVAAGVIPHALDMAFSYAQCGGVGTSKTASVAPSIAGDCGGGGGPIPEGGLMLIPRGTAMPAGLSTMGKALFKALQTYGAFDTDQLDGDSPAFSGDGSAAVTAAFNSSDLTKVGRLLRLVKTW